MIFLVFLSQVAASGVTCPGQTVLASCGSYSDPSGTGWEIGPSSIEPLLSRDMSLNITLSNLPVAQRLLCDILLKDMDQNEVDRIRQDFGEF